MMEAIAVESTRPGRLAPRKVRKQKISVDEMCRRYEKGWDLWSGKPLTGRDAQNWRELYVGRKETPLNEQYVKETMAKLVDTLPMLRKLLKPVA